MTSYLTSTPLNLCHHCGQHVENPTLFDYFYRGDTPESRVVVHPECFEYYGRDWQRLKSMPSYAEKRTERKLRETFQKDPRTRGAVNYSINPAILIESIGGGWFRVREAADRWSDGWKFDGMSLADVAWYLRRTNISGGQMNTAPTHFLDDDLWQPVW